MRKFVAQCSTTPGTVDEARERKWVAPDSPLGVMLFDFHLYRLPDIA